MCTIHSFKSCCCLSLRAGCFIVALLQLIELALTNVAAQEPVIPITIAGNSVILVFIGYLMYGAAVKSHAHLRWWMIINNSLIGILAAIFGFCVFALVLIYVMKLEHHHQRLDSVVVLVLCAAIGSVMAAIIITQGLFSWIVYSYICELRMAENRNRKSYRKQVKEKSIEGEMHEYEYVPV